MIVNIITAILTGFVVIFNVYILVKVIAVGKRIKKGSIVELLKRIPGSLYLKDRGPWESPEFELQVYRVEGLLRIAYVADTNFPIPWENDEMDSCLFISNDIRTDEDLVKAIGDLADSINKYYPYLKPL